MLFNIIILDCTIVIVISIFSGIPAILSIVIPDVQVSGTEDTPEAIHLTATFTLNVGYPDVIPGMSFQSNSFNHKQLQDLKREACVYAQV